MELSLYPPGAKEEAGTYKSAPQQIRFLSERWVDAHVYCPNCGRPKIERYKNNTPVADFMCPDCKEDFELKSTRGAFGRRIVDGAYRTMMERLKSSRNPNLFLLCYDRPGYDVYSFLVIPKHFFVPDLIEKRKPLSDSARRAGWIGCNILLGEIPQVGRIPYVRNQQVVSKDEVLGTWDRTRFLKEEREVEARGWLLDIIRCIENLGARDFSLEDIYEYETVLSRKHPANAHIKAKIRQQLQILRDKGYLEFLGRGHYREV
jgi:type II restriction enzyme